MSRHVPLFPVGASFHGRFPRVQQAASVSGSLLQRSALLSSVAFHSPLFGLPFYRVWVYPGRMPASVMFARFDLI